MSFFFLRFVVRALCRCGCRQNFANFYLPRSLPPSVFFFHPNHNSLFKTSDQLASVPFSGLRFVNGHLDKSFPESIM